MRKLLKTLLPGLIPIFVFTGFDLFLETRYALLAAVIFSLCEFLYYRIRYKYFDKMIFLDTALISILSLISYISQNPLFFKIKPAIIEGILVVILAITAYTPANIILLMIKRYIKTISFSEEQTIAMKRSAKILTIIFGLHVILIIYTAIFSSQEVWAFVSGILFYIIFLIYFAGGIIMKRRHLRKMKK